MARSLLFARTRRRRHTHTPHKGGIPEHENHYWLNLAFYTAFLTYVTWKPLHKTVLFQAHYQPTDQ